MKNFKHVLFVALFFITATVLGQIKVSGTVVDETGQPLPGASVLIKGTKNGTATDFDGNFTLNAKSNKGTIVVSFVGYGNKLVSFVKGNLGKIQLQPDNTLEEVVIVGKGVIDLAGGRKTPIAVSTIKAAEIQTKLGASDVTSVLVNTPSVYVAGQSKGFGDSRISVRGFDQTNTAYLLNGQPINGMEDGKMYWSNWSGINDIAAAVQIQRGLGASKLAISSVGGTTNFVVKSTGKREGGYISGMIANNAYFKTSAFYNTGLSEKGFAASIMFAHWQGDGYMQGGKGSGQTYFISFGYKPNEKHNFNFLLTGAPQQHDQAFSQKISTFLEKGKRFNDNWGEYNGEYLSERKNFYHKPVANLNWDFNINETTSLSTVLYASWGRGGGTGGLGSRGDKIRTQDGQIDFDAIYAKNKSIINGRYGKGYALRASMNMHNWYGLVTNFEKKINDNLTFNLGADLRTYKGEHYRVATDFLGLESWKQEAKMRDHTIKGHPFIQGESKYGGKYKNITLTETFKANPYYVMFNSPNREQRFNWDYSETISYMGAFTQLEYANDNFSAFFQGSISNQYHSRTDFYQYADKSLINGTSKQGTNTPLPSHIKTEGQKADKVENLGYNLKGGLSYTINDNHKVYFNSGYYSRQPYHDNIYLNYSNAVNPLTQNEKIFGLEAGYAFKSSNFTGSLNLYRTSWKDRVTTKSRMVKDVLQYTTNFGVEQLHQGIELDFVYKPIDELKIKGFGSYGDWRYKGKGLTQVQDEDQNLISSEYEDYDGGQVGDAAQTTLGLSVDYKFAKNFSFDVDYRYYDRLFASVGAVKENLQLPSYSLVDLGLSYHLPLEGNNQSIDFRLNVNNVLNTEYLSDLKTNIKTTDLVDKKDPSKGTYKSNNMLYKGIATANEGYFGYGTTWSFSLKYNF
ncbi:MAG: carboxypeptidase-like regulatory domain-containing protein [Tenacibaculum sp.]|nr:carboxypeptidase-like regulatory domain-containing protein [Tenacibaculum sp.]